MQNSFNTSGISIYTDGSCHTQIKVGAWVAILLFDNKKIILHGNETDTTHNRMELLAVIKAIEYVNNNVNSKREIQLFTDSQYVMNLQARAGKLTAENFITKKGTVLQNSDLVKMLYQIFESNTIHLNKIRAHQKPNGIINYNTAADTLSRSLVRMAVKTMLLPPSILNRCN